ncbi:hypothetical protein [Rodentibacter caecimuris]|uniref:hypothetical protein n=1 Tax=Rodentibacter caecimuris TaxID=1796644 RepID=UPI0013DD3705|nr:hypothetical protein [Rodentibacter heylii]
MFIYRTHIHTKKLSNTFLRQPNFVIFIPHFNTLIASLVGENQKFSGAVVNKFSHKLFLTKFWINLTAYSLIAVSQT